MKPFRKRYHQPGTPPGTLKKSLHPQDQHNTRPIQIDLVSYSKAHIDTFQNISIEDCKTHLKKEEWLCWLHVSGTPAPEPLKKLGDLFGLHPLALEDIVNHGQRPKVEQYENQLFVIVNIPVIVEDVVHIEQISLFCGKGYVISFHDQNDDSTYKMLHHRLEKVTNQSRYINSGHLLYMLLDLIVDNGFPVLEFFGERLEGIENNLMQNKGAKKTLQEIHTIKRELILLRRALWPQREVINNLLREEYDSIAKESLIFLQDCYDHTIQIMEIIDSYRDMASSLLEVYLSTVSHHLNEVMRFLTILSTIFIPPTFIVGVYGMNFNQDASSWNMPELSWPYGYVLVWLIILAVMGAMVIYFKRKDWF